MERQVIITTNPEELIDFTIITSDKNILGLVGLDLMGPI